MKLNKIYLVFFMMLFPLLLSGCTTTIISSEWNPDGIIVEDGESEYDHSLELDGGNFVVYWSNDDEFLYMALRGYTEGWISIGFGHDDMMSDSDMVYGWYKAGEVTIYDLYSTGPTGPHPTDFNLGGTFDILEYGGSEENGFTVIEFKRMLDTGDVENDIILTSGETINIIWAIGSADNLAMQHSKAGYGELTLD